MFSLGSRDLLRYIAYLMTRDFKPYGIIRSRLGIHNVQLLKQNGGAAGRDMGAIVYVRTF